MPCRATTTAAVFSQAAQSRRRQGLKEQLDRCSTAAQQVRAAGRAGSAAACLVGGAAVLVALQGLQGSWPLSHLGEGSMLLLAHCIPFWLLCRLS